MILKNILKQYNIESDNCTVKAFGNGLINNTWFISKNDSDKTYILQKINKNVFKEPENIAFNIRFINAEFKKSHPDYLFEAPLFTKNNVDILVYENEYYRLFNFVKNSHTVDVLENANQAFEAAKQFAKFTKNLTDIDAENLKITIPDFHNLNLRFEQFKKVLLTESKRKESAKIEIEYLLQNEKLVKIFDNFTISTVKKRVIHHDTKISNVLFDPNNKGLCVIDLDTVMPGYFISDVGDMMRTYLSPVSEEESDFTKIEIRTDFFEAIVKGYLSEMKSVFTENEINYFVYAGKFMIYMQALRFLTDYLNYDIYYGAKYENQNLIRVQNQIQLLKLYSKKEILFEGIVKIEYENKLA
jgi:Ser/Thr protein kinase RdoA (MazF antagonist)